MVSTARVATPYGAAYTRRLCKHFAHKFSATFDEDRGRIEFPFGLCTIDVDSEYMVIRIDLNDSSAADRAESVVADHLVRMANKDKPIVEWNRRDT